ncbi:hypothetical protein [Streptomyces lydicus]
MSTARPAVSCRALALGARGLPCSNAAGHGNAGFVSVIEEMRRSSAKA